MEDVVTMVGRLTVSVGSGDSLEVRQFTVQERISSLFRVTLVVVSSNPDIDLEAVVGQAARFAIQGVLTPSRGWSGIAAEFHQIAVEESGVSTYYLEIVPTLWLATQRRNYRMFQQTSELSIGLALLSEWGIEPEKRLSGTYKKRKYRVQYGESDYAFMCRMFEDAGISFFFEEHEGETKLVLADAPQTAEARPPIRFLDDTSAAQGAPHVTNTRIGRKVQPGRYTMRDHDYRKDPKYVLAASASSKGGGVEEKLEQYHYVPGAFLFGSEQGDPTPAADDRGKARTDEGEAAILAQKRLDAKRGTATTCAFDTNVHTVTPGVVVSFLRHPRADLGEGKKWLVVESTMSGERDGDWVHHCEAQSAALAFRPPLVTPKPKTQGVESATVVGPPGEEIHCDEFGRVRVHFHWDRESRMDDKSSCWIHVNQPWGGAGYGGSALPRIGQEVLVDFLGGDPDRPVIIGRLYTNLQKTPYKLPDNKTQTGIKSNSTGGTGGYNEMMFEDSGGNELIRMQAEKDMTGLIKNDKQETVGRDRTRLVKRNESVTVGGNRTHLVKLNEKQVVGLNQTLSVGVNRATQVGAIDSNVVGDTHVLMISPPGEGGGGSTSITTTDKKIVLDTGAGASITLEGNTITLNATNIFLFAQSFLGAASFGTTVVGGVSSAFLGSPATTTVSGLGGVFVTSSGGDVSIKGGPMVKINT